VTLTLDLAQVHPRPHPVPMKAGEVSYTEFIAALVAGQAPQISPISPLDLP